MIGWIIVGIVFIICCVVFVFVLKTGNGRKIEVELYEPRLNGAPKRIARGEKIIAYQRRQDDIEKLFLPKKYNKQAIEGIDPSLFIDTDDNTPIIRLLRVSEGMFYPIRTDYDLDKRTLKQVLEERDLIPFYVEEQERDKKRYGENASWLSKYGGIVTGGVIAVTAIVAIYFVYDFAGKQIAEQDANHNAAFGSNVNLLNNIIQYCSGDIDLATFRNTTTANIPLGQTPTS